MQTPKFIYKIADSAEFIAARTTGTYAGAPLDRKDGYIHFSTAAQLPETLRLHFAGQHDLVLAAVRTEALGDRLRWEPARGGTLFPHLYGTLDMQAVAWTEGIEVDADGGCVLPDRLG